MNYFHFELHNVKLYNTSVTHLLSFIIFQNVKVLIFLLGIINVGILMKDNQTRFVRSIYADTHMRTAHENEAILFSVKYSEKGDVAVSFIIEASVLHLPTSTA